MSEADADILDVRRDGHFDGHPDGHSICLLNDSFPPAIDGVANVVVNYAREIQLHHGRALVATPDHPDADDSSFPFPVIRYPSIDTRALVGYVAGIPFSPELSTRIETNQVELLHSHSPFSSTLLARQIRDISRLPLVYTYHTKYDIDIHRAIQLDVLAEGALAALVQNISACDEVWVVSKGAGENLRSLGYEGELTVMENGVDVPLGRVSDETIAAATRGCDLPAGVPVFLFVGRLMWYKGICIILDSLADLALHDQDFRMVFIGNGGDEEAIRAYANKLGLGGKTLFLGAISDRDAIRAWYCRADLFLFPSTFDTNGLVVREAAACSLPSVLVAGSCAAEGVADGINGFLIDESAASLAAKLTELRNRPETLRLVGEGAARDLYLSWPDAVSRAYERYGIVIDRFRSHGYKRQHNLTDALLSVQGGAMSFLGQLNEVRENINEAISEQFDRFGEFFDI